MPDLRFVLLACATGASVAGVFWRNRRSGAIAVPRVIRPYRTAIVLGGVGVVLLISAVLVIPREPPIYLPSGFTMQVIAEQPVTVTWVFLDNYAAHRYRLRVVVNTKTPKSDHESATVLLLLPSASRVLPCDKVITCTGLADVTAPDSCLPAVGCLRLAMGPSQSGSDWQGQVSIDIDAQRLGWDANGVAAEAQLPEVTVFDGNNSAPGNGSVFVQYGVPMAQGYDWNGGLRPDGATGTDVSWTELATEAVHPAPVTATNPDTVQRDSFLVFLSGALLGIAGGALIGGLQEALNASSRDSDAYASADVRSPASAVPLFDLVLVILLGAGTALLLIGAPSSTSRWPPVGPDFIALIAVLAVLAVWRFQVIGRHWRSPAALLAGAFLTSGSLMMVDGLQGVRLIQSGYKIDWDTPANFLALNSKEVLAGCLLFAVGLLISVWLLTHQPHGPRQRAALAIVRMLVPASLGALLIGVGQFNVPIELGFPALSTTHPEVVGWAAVAFVVLAIAASTIGHLQASTNPKLTRGPASENS